MNQCPRCERPHPTDTFVCDTCTTQASSDLTTAATFLDWIDDKRARRSSRSWVGGTIAGREQPLPYDARVGYVLSPIRRHLLHLAKLTLEHHKCRDLPSTRQTLRLHYLEAQLAAWDKVAEKADVSDQASVKAFRSTVADDIDALRGHIDLHDLSAVASWLSEHREWVAGQPWAGEYCQWADDARDTLEKLFDNPPETVALGECKNVHDTPDGRVVCDHILAAPAKDEHYACPRCGHVHNVKDRRLALLQEADDLSVTVADAVKLLRVVGVDVTRQTVHRVVTHFGIESTSVSTGNGRPAKRYPLGAVREAVDSYLADKDTRKKVDTLDKVSAMLSA